MEFSQDCGLSAGPSSVYASEFYQRRQARRCSSDGASACATRRTRRARREALRPALGDLEHMDAWVDPAILAAAAEAQVAACTGSPTAVARYAEIMGFIERSAVGPLTSTLEALGRFRDADSALQYRRPQNWQLTFDEDQGDSVLASC